MPGAFKLDHLQPAHVEPFISSQVMRGSKALMGSRLFSALVRPTFYRQFVGGDTGAELKDTADRLSESGLRLMVRLATVDRIGFTT